MKIKGIDNSNTFDFGKTSAMTDCHIHFERGEYTKEWLDRFIETAVSRNITEIWLL